MLEMLFLQQLFLDFSLALEVLVYAFSLILPITPQVVSLFADEESRIS